MQTDNPHTVTTSAVPTPESDEKEGIVSVVDQIQLRIQQNQVEAYKDGLKDGMELALHRLTGGVSDGTECPEVPDHVKQWAVEVLARTRTSGNIKPK